MTKLSYSEKLQDPRWQKKRLEILSRDKFKCTICGDGKQTLHIHHKIYNGNTSPWNYKKSDLATLCKTCHSQEHSNITLIDGGILKPKDFLTKYPEFKGLFTKIENHKGEWDLYLFEKCKFIYPNYFYSDYEIKVLKAIYCLREFIGQVDCYIYLNTKQGVNYERVGYMGKGYYVEINFFEE